MQQVGCVHHVGYNAYTGSAHGNGATGSQQAGHNVEASANAELVRTTEFSQNPPEGSSSDKLKDSLLMSFVNWVSGRLNTVVGTGETSISSNKKSVSGISQKIIAAGAPKSTASRISADRNTSLRAQANIADDAALHLLSAGALAETISEPGQKHQTLFDADDAGVRVRAKVAQTPF